MKRILSLLLLLSMALTTQAAVYVAGKLVSASTTLDKTNTSGISAGSIKVDLENKAITLTKLTLNTTEDGLRINGNGTDWWDINVSGECYIHTSGKHAIYLMGTAMAQFWGVKDTNPKLRLQESGEADNTSMTVRLYKSYMALYNLDFEIGSYYNVPVFGMDGSGVTMNGVSGKVTCKSTQKPFEHVDYVELNDKSFTVTYPTDVTFNASAQCFYSGGSEVKGSMTFTLNDYKFAVDGVDVDGRNYTDILGKNNSTSRVAYEPSNKTLYLKNVTIASTNASDDAIWIKSNCDYLDVIDVQGTVKVSSKNFSAINKQSKSKLTIKNHDSVSDKLYLESGTYAEQNAIWTCGPLTIDNLTLEATSKTTAAIEMSGSASGNLELLNSDLLVSTAKSGKSAIAGFTDVTYDYCYVEQPTGGKYDTSKKAIVDPSGNLAQTVQVKKGKNTFDITVAGVVVSRVNASDVLGDGTVSYDDATKTLTLNNAYIRYEDGNCINASQLLNINLVGHNNLRTGSESASGINNSYEESGKAATTITSADGTGFLSIHSDGTGISANCGGLTIKNCALYVRGENGGILGNDQGILTIDNATVSAEGRYGSVGYFKGIALRNGVKIVQPEDASIYGGWVNHPGGLSVKSEVVFSPFEVYNVMVKDIHVTSGNCNDVLGDGTVSYDDATKTLTLNNADIEYDDDTNFCIDVWQLLTINLVGHNKVTSQTDEYCAFIITNGARGKAATTITSADGTGSLFCNGIFATHGGLTIKDCTVNIANQYYCIRGWDSEDEDILTIDNATVTAKGGWSAFKYFKDIVLQNAVLVQPAGGQISGGNVVDAEGQPTTEVVIEPVVKYDIKVSDIVVSSANASDVLGDGTVSYDPATNVLTLDNAHIAPCIWVNDGSSEKKIPNNLVVLLKGENTIAEHISVMKIDWTIDGQGSGKLDLSTTPKDTYIPIMTFSNSTLTIKDCTINSDGVYGICGASGYSNMNLVIQNSLVNVKTTKGAAIANWNSLTLKSCEIVKPTEHTYYDVTKKELVFDDETPVTDLIISPIGSAIEGMAADGTDLPAYNLQGQRVGQQYKGIVVKNGRKTLR